MTDINSILKTDFVKALVEKTCGDDVDLVERQDSFAVRRKKEGERDIHRVIILPPRGFTANAIDQMNSHDEADYASIQVKGAVKAGKRNFSKLKDCLLVASQDKGSAVSDLNQPYLTANADDARKNSDLSFTKHSAGTAPFSVVKNDGAGFYHNLINLTDEWLVLKLHKRLRPQKAVDLEPHLARLTSEAANALRSLYVAIKKHGDGIFRKKPEAIKSVLDLPLEKSLPALGEILYVHDSGMHEACTAFAIILKIGKTNPERVTSFLRNAKNSDAIPPYYAEQLIGKLNRFTPQKARSRQLEIA